MAFSKGARAGEARSSSAARRWDAPGTGVSEANGATDDSVDVGLVADNGVCSLAAKFDTKPGPGSHVSEQCSAMSCLERTPWVAFCSTACSVCEVRGTVIDARAAALALAGGDVHVGMSTGAGVGPGEISDVAREG